MRLLKVFDPIRIGVNLRHFSVDTSKKKNRTFLSVQFSSFHLFLTLSVILILNNIVPSNVKFHDFS